MKKLLSILLVAGVALVITAKAEEKSGGDCTAWAIFNTADPNSKWYRVCDCDGGGPVIQWMDCAYCPEPPMLC